MLIIYVSFFNDCVITAFMPNSLNVNSGWIQQQQQQLSLLFQTSWGRLEMKLTENKNKKHKKGTSQRKS
jgi:hypothetical protein